MTEVAALVTPITPFELSQVVKGAHSALGDTVATSVTELFVAHSALETGWWKACYNYNLGNAKASELDPMFCYRTCGEELPTSAVDTTDPRVTVLKVYERQGRPYYSVNFLPPHPQTRFKAYKSLQEAVQAQLALLASVFPKSYRVMRDGNPTAFAIALAAEGYYTADPAKYATSLNQVLLQLRAKGLWWKFDRRAGEGIRERNIRCCHELLDKGPVSVDHRSEVYRSFINAEQWPAGWIGGSSVADISPWKTSCALFVRGVLHWSGSLKTPTARNGQGIFEYLGLTYSHPSWVSNNGSNTPNPGDIFYKSSSSYSNDGHTGMFLTGPSFETGACATAEGGHGAGTLCELSTMSYAKLDSYGRRVWGWWDCTQLGLPLSAEVQGNPNTDKASSDQVPPPVHVSDPPDKPNVVAQDPATDHQDDKANPDVEHTDSPYGQKVLQLFALALLGLIGVATAFFAQLC